MNTTTEFIDAVKAKTGAASDYKLASILDVTRGGISSYRTGRTCLDDETCIKVASLLDIDPAIVLTAIYAERSKNEATKAVWKSLFEKLGGVAAALTLGIMLNVPNPAQASNDATGKILDNSVRTIHYTKSRRRKTRFNPIEIMVNQLLGLS
jgi:plasmid maintenance system antidote protein VapI